MSAVLNEQTVLTALGILQPANAAEVRGYLHQMFRAAGILPNIDEFKKFFTEQETLNRVLTVSSGKDPMYSLTYDGAESLLPANRKIRDKLRLYLLRDAHRRRFVRSRAEVAKELAGVSPALDNSTAIKGREANGLGLRSLGQSHWPRISRQFFRTGSSPSTRDTFPPFISFFEPWQLRRAANLSHVGPLPEAVEWNFKTLGIALGISPGLLTQILRNKKRHYRTFSIPKASGGDRIIESPRVFLKVVQWLLNDFIFMPRLPLSSANHAFCHGRTVVTNAALHAHSPFVGNIDIVQFFTSIETRRIVKFFQGQGFAEHEAIFLAELCSKDGHLPQGAPTSPLLSNSILFEFDEWMLALAQRSGCKYSRYADDITVSGSRRGDVTALLGEAEGFLAGRYGLAVNRDKSRIASWNGRQIVTGVVVNEQPQPPREFRRKIRAAFNNAVKHPKKTSERIHELNGYVGYLNQFKTPTISRSLDRYKAVLTDLKAKTPPPSKQSKRPK